MKKLLLSTTLLVASSAVAFAADMPLATKAAVAPVQIFSWTGCYVGVHAGGGLMTQNTEGVGNGTGAVAGGQAGCNYQDGNWVLGVEGEGYWSGIKSTSGSSNIVNVVFPGNTANSFTARLRNTADYTIAARVGITFDRTLIYGKGGWAWGEMDLYSTSICCGPAATLVTSSSKGTLDGFLVGVGIEHALTRNWTIKGEYNYIGFGNKELTRTQCNGAVCGVTGTNSFDANKHIFKRGVNYLFNLGGPVVARY